MTRSNNEYATLPFKTWHANKYFRDIHFLESVESSVLFVPVVLPLIHVYSVMADVSNTLNSKNETVNALDNKTGFVGH